jgi:hypothetical protein
MRPLFIVRFVPSTPMNDAGDRRILQDHLGERLLAIGHRRKRDGLARL